MQRTDHSEICIILTAVYGLLNFNRKWQDKYEILPGRPGLIQIYVVPQLFYEMGHNHLLIFASNISNDHVFNGLKSNDKRFPSDFHSKFSVSTVVYGLVT